MLSSAMLRTFTKRSHRSGCLFAIGVLFGSLSWAQGERSEKFPPFEADILPIFQANCLVCHGENLRQNGLDLRTRDSVLRGGETGPAIVPGSAARSLLLEKVSSGVMPVGEKKLTAQEIETIRSWIDAGGPKQGENPEALKEQLNAKQVTEREIMVTILHVKCIVCHGKQIQEGGLDLRTRAGLLKGGKSGPAIVPGKPEESLLVRRIAAREMPPPEWQFSYFVRDVSSKELEKLRQWIAAGAPPDAGDVAEVGSGPDSVVSDEDRKFWSFRPPERPRVPTVRNQQLVRSPIDAFLLKKLEAKGLSLSPEADRLTLMRRAYFDLTGLPPDPEEVEAYQKDSSPNAYKRLIDRLLESPHYGERWGRHWLDAAGYADSEGGAGGDLVRPHAYRYRDYVIRSLNADKPYDQFLLEQIAGDELFDYKAATDLTAEQLGYLVATGFLRMTIDPTHSHDVNFVPDRLDTVTAQVEMLSSTVMGLTMGCARCHSHKFDPLPQRDYYRFSAILRTAYDPYDWLIPQKLTGTTFERKPYGPERLLAMVPERERQEVEAHNAPIQGEIDRLERALDETAKPLRTKLFEERLVQLPEAVREDVRTAFETPEEKRELLETYLVEKFRPSVEVKQTDLEQRFEDFKEQAEKTKKAIEEAKKKLKPEPKIRALFDMGGVPTPVYVLRRGNPLDPGPRVEPGAPSVLRDGIAAYKVVKPPWTTDTSGRRLALARWLVQPNHPLTARVVVNRIWQHYFGAGLVATPGNFGHTGARPSHPELLDWLATEFVRQKWSMKAMHQLILTSAAYRQSSSFDPAAHEADADNVLLSRVPMRRMDGESLRDSILKLAGRLDPGRFGPPGEVEVTPEGEVLSKGSRAGFRRSIYMRQRRSEALTLLEVFDAPQLDPNCLKRGYSTVPTQALQLMNSEMVRENARYFAGRVMDVVGEDVGKQVDRVYLAALARWPSPKENKLGVQALRDLTRYWLEHLEEQEPAEPKRARARWLALSSFCHEILNSPDFIYID